jgi:hypothetical protein
MSSKLFEFSVDTDDARGSADILDDHLLAQDFTQPGVITRAITSNEPPAANGTTMVMGRVG